MATTSGTSAAVDSPGKPRLTLLELVFEIHSLLLRMCDDDGYVTGFESSEALQEQLFSTLEKSYVFYRPRAARAFSILSEEGARGDANGLRGRGMPVYRSVHTDRYLTDKAMSAQLKRAYARIDRLENENRRLLALREEVSAAIAESYKNE